MKGAAIFVVAWLGSIAATSAAQGAGERPASAVDHLVYAVPDLQAGIERIERLLGVRATPGGQHPGRGTRNALVALGPSSYLEIIGPDPEQPTPAEPRPFGIDRLTAPRVVTWAARAANLDKVIADARQAGVALGPLAEGSRRRGDGVLLLWRYSDPRTVVADGVVPFFIDWGSTPHPATTSARGGTLAALRAEHPDDENVQRILERLHLDVRVDRGPAAALIATITTPSGPVELR
jgi:hypothetical protein